MERNPNLISNTANNSKKNDFLYFSTSKYKIDSKSCIKSKQITSNYLSKETLYNIRRLKPTKFPTRTCKECNIQYVYKLGLDNFVICKCKCHKKKLEELGLVSSEQKIIKL